LWQERYTLLDGPPKPELEIPNREKLPGNLWQEILLLDDAPNPELGFSTEKFPDIFVARDFASLMLKEKHRSSLFFGIIQFPA
jgi:hypothetical protein